MMLLVSVSLFAQEKEDTDAKCISMMKIPLEGPDSVFIPALVEGGFVEEHPADKEPDTYYFSGDFYGIKANLEVCVDEKTKLLSDVTVTCGPYRTHELFDRNRKYLLGKLLREWGNFTAKGDGSLYLLNDYGYIQESQILLDNGSNSIRYFYLNSTPYYKDAANLGLKGQVQEVITENPIMENDILHFDESLILILSDHNVKPEHLAMPAAMARELPVYIINGGFSRNEAWGGACNQLDVYTTILDLLKIEAPWRGLGHTLLTTDYQNSVSDDSRKWDYSEWMISSNYFNQP